MKSEEQATFSDEIYQCKAFYFTYLLLISQIAEINLFL